MKNQVDLKAAERKVFSLSLEDGLWDIFVGLMILGLAVSPILTPILGDFWASFIFLPIWGLSALGVIVIKRKVVTPRIGIVRLGRRNQMKKFRITLTILSVVLLLTVLGSLFFINISNSAIFRTSFMSGMILAIFLIGANVLQQTRFVFYGILTALAPVIGELMWIQWQTIHHGYPISFGFVSVFIMVFGLVKFISFIKIYSIPEEGEA